MRVSRRSGHASPRSASVTIGRERCCTPSVPHVTSQALQSSQSPTAQSTGHGPRSQSVISSSGSGHAAPPSAGSVVISRVRVRLPASHVVLHSPHAPKALTTQSVGQACVLQSSSFFRVASSAATHATPPFAALTLIAFRRSCFPVPQLFEHDLAKLDCRRSLPHNLGDLTESAGHEGNTRAYHPLVRRGRNYTNVIFSLQTLLSRVPTVSLFPISNCEHLRCGMVLTTACSRKHNCR